MRMVCRSRRSGDGGARSNSSEGDENLSNKSTRAWSRSTMANPRIRTPRRVAPVNGRQARTPLSFIRDSPADPVRWARPTFITQQREVCSARNDCDPGLAQARRHARSMKRDGCTGAAVAQHAEQDIRGLTRRHTHAEQAGAAPGEPKATFSKKVAQWSLVPAQACAAAGLQAAKNANRAGTGDAGWRRGDSGMPRGNQACASRAGSVVPRMCGTRMVGSFINNASAAPARTAACPQDRPF